MPEIRKVIYTTNAIESLSMRLRKLTRNRRYYPLLRMGRENARELKRWLRQVRAAILAEPG